MTATNPADVGGYNVRMGNRQPLITLTEMRQFKILEAKIPTEELQSLVESKIQGCIGDSCVGWDSSQQIRRANRN